MHDIKNSAITKICRCVELTDILNTRRKIPLGSVIENTSRFSYSKQTVKWKSYFIFDQQMVWRRNRIIFNCKDSSWGSIFRIYIRLQTISLLCKLCSMGIISPIEIANEEYVNLRELTKKLANLIMQQEHSYTVSEHGN